VKSTTSITSLSIRILTQNLFPATKKKRKEKKKKKQPETSTCILHPGLMRLVDKTKKCKNRDEDYRYVSADSNRSVTRCITHCMLQRLQNKEEMDDV